MQSNPAPESQLAVVTGASSGIGEELARQLAARGHAVLAVARRADRLSALAKEVKARGHAPVIPFSCDVTEEGAPKRILERAGEVGTTGWLVNNAGMVQVGRFVKSDGDRAVAQIRLNCEALVMLTHAFLPGMVERRKGVVLNVASSAGFQPTPFFAVYGSTKAFALSFSEALSEELRGTGVTITALCPGPVTTEIFEASGTEEGRKRPRHEISAAVCARSGIEAAAAGKVMVVPGLTVKLLGVSSRYSPRALVRRVATLTGLKLLGLPPVE